MKKILCILILTLGCMYTASAQINYKSAVGLRLTNGGGITYKTAMGNNAFEAIGYFNLGRKSNQINLSGLYEITKDIPGVNNLDWYYGLGLGVGISTGHEFDEDNGLNLGVEGIVGMEYTLPKAPFNFSLDWKPRIGIGKGPLFSATGIALSIRYVLKRNGGGA